MEKDKNKQKINKDTQDTGSVGQYSNSTFFKKKDERAKTFLAKHPIPDSFWK